MRFSPRALKLVAVSLPDLGDSMPVAMHAMHRTMLPHLSAANLWQVRSESDQEAPCSTAPHTMHHTIHRTMHRTMLPHLFAANLWHVLCSGTLCFDF
ncbi:unnamed protein product [Closterium sp. NIES-54]